MNKIYSLRFDWQEITCIKTAMEAIWDFKTLPKYYYDPFHCDNKISNFMDSWLNNYAYDLSVELDKYTENELRLIIKALKKHGKKLAKKEKKKKKEKINNGFVNVLTSEYCQNLRLKLEDIINSF